MPPFIFYYNLEHGIYNLGGRLQLRPVEPEDGTIISYWRNSQLARLSFFTKDVVTPDSHRKWLANKSPYDLVWMVDVAKGLERDTLIGMIALAIDPKTRSGEYGRVFVDPRHQRQGYGTELDYMVLAVAFEVFHLENVWLEIYASNTHMIQIHEHTGWKFFSAPMNADADDVPTRDAETVFMHYNWTTWGERRAQVIQDYDWQLPEWCP